MTTIKAVLQKPKSLGLALACAIFLVTGCSTPENTTPSTQRSGGTESSGGTKSTSGNKVPDVDACSLVTRSEADAIMGKLREAPKPATTLRDEKACSYLNSDGANATIRV